MSAFLENILQGFRSFGRRPPTLDEARYRIEAMRRGSPLSERRRENPNGMGAPTATPEDYLVGSLDAVTPFMPIPLAMRGVKRVGKVLHGVVSNMEGEALNVKSIVDQGFTKGMNLEIGRPSVSTSYDPHFVLNRFADNDPRKVVVSEHGTRPEDTWNLPPDLYNAGIHPAGPTETVNIPNYQLMEAEVNFGIPPRQVPRETAERAAQVKDEMRKVGFGNPGYKELQDENRRLYLEMEQYTQPSAPGLEPRRIRKAERPHMEAALDRLNNWADAYRALGASDAPPDRLVRNAVEALDALKTAGPGGMASRGEHNAQINILAKALVTGSNPRVHDTFEAIAYDPDDFAHLRGLASDYLAKFDTLRRQANVDPDVLKQMEEANWNISDLGDPKYRQRYRDVIKARDVLMKELRDYAYQVLPGT